MRPLILCFAMLGLASTGQIGAAEAQASPGLSVSNQTLLLKGKPYRGVGVNYFSLASRVLSQPDDRSSLTNLAALARAGIPFVRFMCGGYWPAEQRLYLTNREMFFQRLDQVVRAAEQNRIGLIPSLFWHLPTVPDLVGEPMAELGNTNSRSITLIRAYTADVIKRYSASPAIWAWEFGNEANLSADLPNASEHRPPIVPTLGTPEGRTAADELSSSHVQVAATEFARTVRQFDSSRLILSGNALPRASAWHNSNEHSWTADTLPQFREVLRRDNAEPMNGISVHIYPDGEFPAGTKNISDAIALVSREARALSKPLFIGEFGVSRRAGTLEQQQAEIRKILAALEQASVPLAAVWVFDLPQQEEEWNITFQNDRAVLLPLIANFNKHH